MVKQPQGMDQGNEKAQGMLPMDALFLDGLRNLSPEKTLERVLEHPDTPRLIRTMSSEDFFFLIKKVGEDASMELLRLATLDQWQYLLDVESWEDDRLALDQTDHWLELLLATDPQRLVKWLFFEGQGLAHYYLYRSIMVEAKTEDEEIFEVGPGFFSIDGFFYVRPLEEGRRGFLERLLRTMAEEDLLKYQSLLTGLAGLLPAELEEEMYRMRNVRLAEHGFLPREEAIAVYAPNDPENLRRGASETDIWPPSQLEEIGAVPRWPLQTIEQGNLLFVTLSQFSDDAFMDRIRLEFAGLCNQILATEGLSRLDPETLQAVQRQAAGYLNLILKERSLKDSGEGTRTAENLLRLNPLVSLFRAGFGLAIKRRWKAEQWLKDSWFQNAGLEFSFWGEAWEGTLTGLLKDRPMFYDAASPTGFRHFESLSDLSHVEKILGFLDVLDRLMAVLTKEHALDPMPESDPFPLTVHHLLLTFWARGLLELKPGFAPLTPGEMKTFLERVRAGDTAPPYRMFGFEEQFLEPFVSRNKDASHGPREVLKNALTRIWHGFSDEMADVPTEAMDARYSKYVLIRSGS